jgi:hypothetical protein
MRRPDRKGPAKRHDRSNRGRESRSLSLTLLSGSRLLRWRGRRRNWGTGRDASPGGNRTNCRGRQQGRAGSTQQGIFHGGRQVDANRRRCNSTGSNRSRGTRRDSHNGQTSNTRKEHAYDAGRRVRNEKEQETRAGVVFRNEWGRQTLSSTREVDVDEEWINEVLWLMRRLRKFTC